MAGATAASLSLTNVQMSDGGSYDVLVCNSFGCVTSAVAPLRFTAVADSFNPGAGSWCIRWRCKPMARCWWAAASARWADRRVTRLAACNADGSLDSSFNPAANADVYALAVQADGRILVGGNFTTLGGQTRRFLARLNANGTLDTSFNPAPGNMVYCLAVQGDGKILLGGAFVSVGGQTHHRIARLNADGTLDTTFNAGASNTVYSLAVQTDGKILVGGAFTTLGGQTRNYIGRLNADGTLDTAFNPGAGGNVYALAIRADDRILVGGYFTTLAGQSRTALGLLNADGTLNTNFNAGVGASYSATVWSLALQSDGKVLLGGFFNNIGGQARIRSGGSMPMARWTRLSTRGPTTWYMRSQCRRTERFSQEAFSRRWAATTRSYLGRVE